MRTLPLGKKPRRVSGLQCREKGGARSALSASWHSRRRGHNPSLDRRKGRPTLSCIFLCTRCAILNYHRGI
eukprot:1077883-Rhodomonas_salina.1